MAGGDVVKLCFLKSDGELSDKGILCISSDSLLDGMSLDFERYPADKCSVLGFTAHGMVVDVR